MTMTQSRQHDRRQPVESSVPPGVDPTESAPTPPVDPIASLDFGPVTLALPAPLSFGAAFRAWLHQPEQTDLVEHEYCGWLDDGCAVLALAVEQWLGPVVDLVAVCEGDLVQHVVARVGERWYLDAGGLWDARGLLDHWERDHGVHGPRLVPLDHTIETSWTAADDTFRIETAAGEPLRAPWLVTHEDVALALAERLGHHWSAEAVRQLLVGRS